MYLGVDMGGTATKIVAADGARLLAVSGLLPRGDAMSIESVAAFFLREQGISTDSLQGVFVTGIASSAIGERLLGLPVQRQEEFASIVRGGLALAGETRAIVVSLGTGTAFVRADENGFTHLGGSGVGGGMLLGLCRKLYGLDSFDAIVACASRGDLANVDLRIGDMTERQIGSLPPHVTVANFGKIEPDARKEDVVCGLVNTVLESVGVMATLACREERRVVATGGLTALPQARVVFEGLCELTGVTFLIPDNAAYATAFGAVLSGLHAGVV